MEVAVVTGLPAEWNMNVDSCHYLKGLLFDFRQVNLPAEWNMNVDACHDLRSFMFDFRQVNPPAEWNMYINPGQIKYF